MNKSVQMCVLICAAYFLIACQTAGVAKELTVELAPTTISTSKPIASSTASLTTTAGTAYVEQRFHANPDGSLLDTATGLTWAKDNGQSMTWEAAQVFCEDFSSSGHNDWRMPTLNELNSLFENTDQSELVKLLELKKCMLWGTDESKSEGGFFALCGLNSVPEKEGDSYITRVLPVRGPDG
jgi:hypothetical protein